MMKTHKGLKGRLKVTKNGKVMHRRSGKSHLMSTKNGKRVRQARAWRQVGEGNQRILKRQYNFGL